MSYELSLFIVVAIVGAYVGYGAFIAIRDLLSEEVWSSPQMFALKAVMGDAGAAAFFTLLMIFIVPLMAVTWPMLYIWRRD